METSNLCLHWDWCSHNPVSEQCWHGKYYGPRCKDIGSLYRFLSHPPLYHDEKNFKLVRVKQHCGSEASLGETLMLGRWRRRWMKNFWLFEKPGFCCRQKCDRVFTFKIVLRWWCNKCNRTVFEERNSIHEGLFPYLLQSVSARGIGKMNLQMSATRVFSVFFPPAPLTMIYI